MINPPIELRSFDWGPRIVLCHLLLALWHALDGWKQSARPEKGVILPGRPFLLGVAIFLCPRAGKPHFFSVLSRLGGVIK
jgi:hypothetical protein